MSSPKSSSRRHCHKKKCCVGPTGYTGPTGAPGTNGVTGPTGPANAGFLMAFASGTATSFASTFGAGAAQSDLIIGMGNARLQTEQAVGNLDSTLLPYDTMVTVSSNRILTAVSASFTFTAAPTIASSTTYILYAAVFLQRFGLASNYLVNQGGIGLLNPLNSPVSSALTSVTPPVQYTTLYANYTLPTTLPVYTGDKFLVAFYLTQTSGSSTSLPITGYGSIGLTLV